MASATLSTQSDGSHVKRPSSPALWLLGGLTLILLGILSEVANGRPAAEVALRDSFLIVVHFHFAVILALVCLVCGGLLLVVQRRLGRVVRGRIDRVTFFVAFAASCGVLLGQSWPSPTNALLIVSLVVFATSVLVFLAHLVSLVKNRPNG